MAPMLFPLPIVPVLHTLADVDETTAMSASTRLGFLNASGHWQRLIDHPEIDLVDITAPNSLHEAMARSAIDAGKAIYCEKPLATSAAEAGALARAAAAANVPSFLGFNYLRNPLVELARDLIATGELGEIWEFRGVHAEDYMCGPDVPWTWRMEAGSGDGAVADLGSHIISLARYLLGAIEEVSADVSTRVRKRMTDSVERTVNVDDEVRALIRFENGVAGSISASWIATGRKLHLVFEVYGSKGSMLMSMERMNELRLYLRQPKSRLEGFTQILTNAEHKDYEAFCPAPGHQLGFNDIKTIEVKEIVLSLFGGSARISDFAEGYQIQRVVDAMILSAKERRWVRIHELP
jgi:predicted dehydrogenase